MVGSINTNTNNQNINFNKDIIKQEKDKEIINLWEYLNIKNTGIPRKKIKRWYNLRVKVKDFNCIREAEFQFLPGLTVLQGESNGGKSSVFRAIENTIFNQSGTANVQHGKQFYLVGIENNGHKVVFKKGKAGGVYKVDGVEYSKVGVGQVEQVADALGIRETVLAGEKIRLNFWSQMGYPFLLDRSPGQLYKFIVDSSESESLSSVLKDIAKDIKDTNTQIVTNDSKLDLLRSQLKAVEDRLVSAEQVEETCKNIIAMDSEYTLINTLDSVSNDFKNKTNEIANLYTDLNSVVQIDTTSLDTVREEYEVVAPALDYQKKLEELNAERAKLDSVEQAIATVSAIESIDIESLDLLNSQVSSYRKILQELENLNADMSNVQVELDNLQVELSEFKVCPLCGGELHANESCA